MTIEHLVLFNMVLWVSIVSPGPAILVALQTTLTAGRSAGLAVGVGLACMAVTWTTLALFGLDALFLLFPWAYTVTKVLGALYLLYLAWNIWRDAKTPLDTTAKPAQSQWLRAFRRGFLINMMNPKSVMFAAAVLVVIFPKNMQLWEVGVVVGNHLVAELIFYTALSFGMSTEPVKRAYLKAKVYLDRATALVLGGLGLRLWVG